MHEFSNDDQLVGLSGPFIFYDLPANTLWWVKVFNGIGYMFYLVIRFVFRVGSMLQGGNFVVRRDALEKIGGYDTNIEFYGEDTDVARRVNKVGKVVFTLKLPALSSGRRLAKEGLFTIGIRYATNILSITFLKNPFTQKSIDVRPENESGIPYKPEQPIREWAIRVAVVLVILSFLPPRCILSIAWSKSGDRHTMNNRAKIFFLLLGDIVALYAALFLALVIRYGGAFYEEFKDVHAIPFSIIFVIWLIIFFIAGLYDLRRLRDNLDFVKTLWLAIATSAVVSIIDLLCHPALRHRAKNKSFHLRRRLCRHRNALAPLRSTASASSGDAPNKVLLIGDMARRDRDRKDHPRKRPARLRDPRANWTKRRRSQTPEMIQKIVDEKNINCVVVSRHAETRRPFAGHALQAFFAKASSSWTCRIFMKPSCGKCRSTTSRKPGSLKISKAPRSSTIR